MSEYEQRPAAATSFLHVVNAWRCASHLASIEAAETNPLSGETLRCSCEFELDIFKRLVAKFSKTRWSNGAFRLAESGETRSLGFPETDLGGSTKETVGDVLFVRSGGKATS
jgi:hypothetical protein